MNTIVGFRKCTLTDKELVEKVDKMTDEIYDTGKSMEQLLLGYAVTNDGQTVFERLQSDQKLLTGETLLNQ